jgi:hypothetical protein
MAYSDRRTEEAGMSDMGPGEPPEAEEGFMLWEGWMFGAVMYEAAAEHIERLPAANDNEAEG